VFHSALTHQKKFKAKFYLKKNKQIIQDSTHYLKKKLISIHLNVI